MKYSTLAVTAATILMTSGAMTFGASGAFAQDGHRGQRVSGEERSERMVERLDRKLDLTDAQESQVKELFAAEAADLKAWREANEDASREDRREFMESNRESHQAALEGVLTTEQVAELQEMGPLRPRARRGVGNRGGTKGDDGRRGERRGFGADLDLSDEQKSQLKELRENTRAELKAWHEANPEATRDERRDYREQQRENQRQRLESILTPEQLEKLKSRRNERGDR